MNMLCALRSAAAGTFLLANALAQAPDVPIGATGAYGVSTTDAVRAMGPGYSARFDERGLEYVPVLGRSAARPYPVRFRLESVRRGGLDLPCDGAAAPVVEGNSVRYARSPTLTEVYDARQDGIEQSFVFAERPEGGGDLVVRGSIDTDLPLASASDDGVRYELPGTGGVTFGAVTGIDATGACARGAIRVADGGHEVEWVLPAAFVDQAAYPLVLDPLIGSAFAVGDAPGVDVHPAVAFDQTTGRYLVAWTVVVSSVTCELRAQLVTASGTPLGPLFTISGFANPDFAPAVAACNAMDRFLVVWRTNGSQAQFVRCAIVNPAGVAQVSPVTDITGGSSIDYQFAVGGDLRAIGDKCLVAWSGFGSSGQRVVRAATVQIPASGAPILGIPIDLDTGETGSMAVSRSAGAAGRWLVAWTRNGSFPGAFTDVRCATVSEAGTQCSTAVDAFSGGATGDVTNLDAATLDGSQFVIAWQDDAVAKVRLRLVNQASLCPGTLALGATVDPIVAVGAQTHPSIDFAKTKYVLSWTQTVAGTGLRTFVKALDPATCGSCGLEHALETSVAPQDQSAVAARWAAGDSASDEALVVWSNGTIRGRRFEARSNDVVTSMGGACSLTGFNDFATYNGDAVLGATDFELVLANPVSLPLVMIVGFSNISVPCGSCTVVPSLDILFPATNPLPVFIPCDPLLVDVEIYTQWLLLKPSDCPILPDFAFSNALRFKIGE